MSVSRVVIATGMAAILATFTFCASFMILSAALRFFGLALALARREFGAGDPGLDLGLKLAMNAGPLSLLGALVFTGLAGGITFIFVMQLQRSRPLLDHK